MRRTGKAGTGRAKARVDKRAWHSEALYVVLPGEVWAGVEN